jgi:hypothetical protein
MAMQISPRTTRACPTAFMGIFCLALLWAALARKTRGGLDGNHWPQALPESIRHGVSFLTL